MSGQAVWPARRRVKWLKTYRKRIKRVPNRKRLFMLPCALLWASAAMAQIAPANIFQLNGEVGANANYPPCSNYVVKGSNPTALIQPTACDTWALLNGSGTVGQFKGGPSDYWLVRDFAAAGQGGLAYTQGSKDIDNPHGGW